MGSTLNGVRVAIYARFSSDKQSESSIEDQVHRARELIRTRGGEPDQAQVFADFAVSGASMDRPGMAPLLEAIRGGRVDVVVTESVDRVSRDIGDAHRFRKLLVHHDCALECLDGTRIGSSKDTLSYDIRALFAEQYRVDLADKTLRGLEGRARIGAPTGAVAYGYRIVKKEPDVRSIEIDEDRAAVVRRIFERYAAGDSFAGIASKLNAEGVPPPRAHSRRVGDGWMHSAVRSMLLNERYRGTWAFGARQWVKAPGSNQRRPKARRTGPLVKIERPELALVDPQTWATVQARFARHVSVPRGRRSYMLSGLLFCGVCGGRMTHNGGGSRPHFACSLAVKRGMCTHRRNVPVTLAEELVLAETQRELWACIDHVRELLDEELRAWAATLPSRRAELEKKIAISGKQIARVIDLVVASGSADASQRLRGLEAERDAYRVELASLVEKPKPLPTPAQVLAGIASLGELRSAPADEARELLRPTLKDGRVLCTPAAEPRTWTLSWGVLPMVMLAGRPSLGISLGRPSDAAGCGGPLALASDVVRECEARLAV